MRGRLGLSIGLVAAIAVAASSSSSRAEVESGVIRLAPSAAEGDAAGDDPVLPDSEIEARRGFDYQAFGSRLDGYWFQRKLHLREGRDDEAARQAENVRAFTTEEGIRRLENPAGALVSEARRFLEEGSHDRALASLALAEALDPGRPQVRFLRARVLFRQNGGTFGAAAEWLAGVRASFARIVSEPTLLHPAALAALLACLGAGFAFAALMALRYQVPLRHEVEEAFARGGKDTLGPAAGWAVLLLPLVLWVGAGWVSLWWIVVTFRYMRRSERIVAAAVLLATALSVPAYRLSVGLYGISADPKVRTTVASAAGAYDPDRIVRLQQLVEADPDDPTLRFLLAGLYKNGRYFEEAFDEYKKVLKVSPETWQARVNIGNIYFAMGQYGEAVAQYRKAIEMRPGDVLAYCDMYLAQTESFRLNEATETLNRAKDIDARGVSRLLERDSGADRSVPIDATVNLGAVWKAALEGERLEDWLRTGDAAGGSGISAVARHLLNPLSVASLLSIVAGGALVLGTRRRAPARRCVRCGRPFCSWCKTSREAHDYCSQCVHLYVLQDGLAPQTKTRKLYEVEAHERRSRRLRQLVSLPVPGAGFVLRGAPLAGLALVFLWCFALLSVWPRILWPLERLLGLDLRLDLLRSGTVPAIADLEPAILVAVPLLALVWTLGNSWLRRPREA